ncbi:ABC transporter ATP-binding protein [Anaerosporobacter faecicola]|uniref:ABC transporter ATP-binding protein n=1 Tax=Anaerosporobacter faecicola TaxID=2718714 RepID=UPI00143BB0B1|nr:ABC transporter ATP-binding protein [Anaerosporobacter faecicola]
MNVLEAKQLTKIYGDVESENATKALAGVDFKVEEGEFVAIMGPSGSGKSTLVSILSGITEPTTGSVVIKGKRIDQMNRFDMALFRRRSLGFVFQEFNLLDSLTIKENIILPMVLDKKDGSAMDQKAAEVMKLFEIDHIGDKYPYEISGGQQQRAAVCRSLVNDPVMVFADEPTGNLDSKSANAVMNCFKKMNDEKNTTILMVTHDVFAASFCKKVIFIKDGKICLEVASNGTRKEFFHRILDCQAVVGGENNDL